MTTAAREANDGLVERAFGVAMIVSGTWFLLGLLLDGWAHNHLDLSKEGFFTPYHAVFYTGYFALVATIGTRIWWNHKTLGVSWKAAVPDGYGMTLAGLAAFAVGGLLDMTWHVVFGVEQDTEALFSPTHLLLASGGALMLGGTIGAGFRALAGREPRMLWPALIPVSFFATLVTFFFMWSFTTEASRGTTLVGELREYKLEHGVATIVVRSLIMTGFALWAARRTTLPFGAVTFVTALPATLVAAMLSPALPFIAVNFGASLLAGLATDAWLLKHPATDCRISARVVAFGLPFAFWAIYMIATVVGHGTWWSPHVAYGASVIGGLCGLLLALATERQTVASRTS